MKRIIVVGNGMVGHHFIDQFIQQDKMAEVQITTFSEESRLAYDRVQLSAYFSGKTAGMNKVIFLFINIRINTDIKNRIIFLPQSRYITE